LSQPRPTGAAPSGLMAEIAHIGIVGGGAWGTALALTARRGGRGVTLWAREPEGVHDINTAHRHQRYLPGHASGAGSGATATVGGLSAVGAVLLVARAQASHALARELAPLVPRSVPIVVCAKGLEAATGRLMPEVVAEALPAHDLGHQPA